MPPSDDAYDKLSSSFFKYLFEGMLNEKEERAKKLAFLFAIIILAYAGVEAVKLFFRTDFGKKGLHIWKVLLSVSAFIFIAFFTLNAYYDYPRYENVGASRQSFLYTAIIYFVLAISLIIKAVSEFKKRGSTNVDESYRGNSTVLSFLSDSGWEQSKIQNLAEPLLVFAMGIFFLPINLFLGMPLIFCALSVWIHYGYEYLRGLINARNNLADKKGKPQNTRRTFARVIN